MTTPSQAQETPPYADANGDFPRVQMSAQLVGLECLHHARGKPDQAFFKFKQHAPEILLAELYKRLENRMHAPYPVLFKEDLDELAAMFEAAIYPEIRVAHLDA